MKDTITYSGIKSVIIGLAFSMILSVVLIFIFAWILFSSSMPESASGAIIFAVSLVFSFVVAYDAMGLRMESGKQATTINQIIDELVAKNPKSGYKKLKEQLGHNPIQVLVGAIFGILMAYFLIHLI